MASSGCGIHSSGHSEKTDGISFYKEMIGEDQKKHDFLYWEYPASGGLQAIRMGKWKGIKRNLFKGPSKLELYDLLVDEKELNDLFGKAIVEILNEFPKWKALSLGDEDRRTIYFNHKNHKELGFLNHKKTLKYTIFRKPSGNHLGYPRGSKRSPGPVS